MFNLEHFKRKKVVYAQYMEKTKNLLTNESSTSILKKGMHFSDQMVSRYRHTPVYLIIIINERSCRIHVWMLGNFIENYGILL